MHSINACNVPANMLKFALTAMCNMHATPKQQQRSTRTGSPEDNSSVRCTAFMPTTKKSFAIPPPWSSGGTDSENKKLLEASPRETSISFIRGMPIFSWQEPISSLSLRAQRTRMCAITRYRAKSALRHFYLAETSLAGCRLG